MRAREVIKILKKEGWYEVGGKGSHINFKHPTIKGKITVPSHSGDIPRRTLDSILRQAGLK